ncbi:MAG TPA: HAMP domain-containing sensor histidine kinase [Chryseolinea sp.]|nr:HAMP domain-containing sensor histidine kinase [Chryseolinea sp.]
MKLINRLTIWYLAITTFVLLASGLIVFYRVQAEIENEVKTRLKRDIDHAAQLISEGLPIDSVRGNQLDIKELDHNAALIPLQVTDSMGFYSLYRRALDRKFTVASSHKIQGKHYYISAYNFIAEPDEILEGIIASLAVTLLILLLFVALASRQMSRLILSNFNRTLKTIQGFNLKQKNRIKLTHTRTYEFKELNQFLEKMTNKALDDYRSLKEFSENASHELQTPLAIIRGKLELLMETRIDEKQASLIEGIQNAVQKLSAVNQSLILLTKLENQEYPVKEKMNFSHFVKGEIESFRELIEMKSLSLTTKIEPEVYLNLNPVLADILFNNLFTNAIRHNLMNGSIDVTLTSSGLSVKNTGDPPKVPTQELFKRFKKDKQSSESTGLGLAIVKQICDLNNFIAGYEYTSGLHELSIRFSH